ncbi:MAG: ATP synthase F0 subunit B [Polyangiaceae bacterium]
MKQLAKNKILRRSCFVFLVASLSLGLLTMSDAEAQPQPTRQPNANRKPNPNRGLPAGHPPINQRPRRAQPRRPAARPRTGRPIQIPGFGTRGVKPPTRPKIRYPRDEHGHCVGDGMNNLPKPINFVHGLLMANNDKALAAAPPPKRVTVAPEANRIEKLKASFEANWPRYKWQWTPSLWRYENHQDHCDPRNEPTPLAATVFNVGLVFFLLVRFGRPKVREALVKRKQSVMSEIDKATKIKREAKKRLAEYNDRLEHLEEQRDELRAQYRLEGEHEEQLAREELSSARDRMMGDAHFLVTQESKIARDQLSKEALEGALQAAEDLLKSSVTPADHDRLAEEYLDQIGSAMHDDGVKS